MKSSGQLSKLNHQKRSGSDGNGVAAIISGGMAYVGAAATYIRARSRAIALAT